MNTKSWDDLSEIENVKTKPKSLMLLDGNNIAYRFLQTKEYNSFQDSYVRTVQSLSKSYNAEETIVCFDFGRSYYRTETLSTYKANRTKPQDEEARKHYEEFFDCLNEIPSVLPYRSLKFRGLEADDLITYLVENLSERYEHTWIISSDRDLYQLISDSVSIFNLFSRKEITIDYFLETYNITPEEYLLSRILEGDKSDNIIGVEGIGPKRAQQLAKEYKTLNNLLAALPISGKSKYINNLNSSKDTLILNEKLVCLRKYNKKAIELAKEGDELLAILAEIVKI